VHAHDGADFLAAELDNVNKTIADIFASHASSFENSPIEARSSINGKCQGHGNIEDRLSNLQINTICYAMASGVAGGVTAIVGVVDSKVCIEAGTGHPLPSCKSSFAYINTVGTTFTGGMVNEYCPQFLSLFVLCHGSDAQATAQSNKAFEMTGFNTQKDYNCKESHRGEKCVATTAQ
jgi:hypothetical protein